MASRKKKQKPKNSNVNKRTQPKPLIIIQQCPNSKVAWMILVAEFLKFLTLLWTEYKKHIIEFFNSF